LNVHVAGKQMQHAVTEASIPLLSQYKIAVAP
jgi:hypothetical protein